MNLTARFGPNFAGRDFVVGDVHGMFDLLRQRLAELQFDDSRDRLFSVGDLVDRGPQSIEVCRWLRQPWFHAVRGNHEQMAIDTFRGFGDPGLYAANGGRWFLELNHAEQQLIVEALEALPITILIERLDGYFGIVHSGPIVPHWDNLVADLSEQGPLTNARVTQCLWSRERWQGGEFDDTPIVGPDLVYCGHTPVGEVTRLGNVVNLDTMAYRSKILSVIEIGLEVPA